MKTFKITLAVLIALGTVLISMIFFKGYSTNNNNSLAGQNISSAPYQSNRTNGADYRNGMMMGSGSMMGNASEYNGSSVQQISFSDANKFLQATTASARVDKAKNQVTFSGKQIEIYMAAVEPKFPDTTFEVAGLVNPTIVVPTGSSVTIHLINMDYGQGMAHGLAITNEAPPYQTFSMMGDPDTLIQTPILSPRSSQNAADSSYWESSLTFQPTASGNYYYLCQFFNHASKGMYGKLVIS